MSDIIRGNEKRVWLLSQHLIDVLLARPTDTEKDAS